MKSRRGFTLIELMIVILVIAILATIVGLAIGAVGAKARAAKAKMEIRNLNEAANHFWHHTAEDPTCYDDLRFDPGLVGWDGPYIDHEPKPPAGWTYEMGAEPFTGRQRWKGTGPGGVTVW